MTVAGEQPEWHRTLASGPARVRTSAAWMCLRPEQDPLLSARLRCRRTRDEGVMDVSIAAVLARRCRWRGGSGRGSLPPQRLRQYPGGPAAEALRHATARDHAAAAPRATPSACWRTRGLLEAVTFASCRARSRRCSSERRDAPRDAGQSDQRRPRCDAAVDPRQPDAGGGAQRGARLCRCRIVRGRRHAISTRPTKGQVPSRPACASGLYRPRHWEGKPRPVDAFDAKADALALLQTFGAPVDQPAGLDRCAGLLPSRPLGGAAARAHRPGAVRRTASRRAGGLRRQGSGRRLRGLPRPLPLPRSKGAARPLLDCLAVPAAGARLRVPGGCDGAGRQADPGRQERRQGPHHRRQGVRPVPGRRAAGQEVDRLLGHDPAARAHADRTGDRSPEREDRRRR